MVFTRPNELNEACAPPLLEDINFPLWECFCSHLLGPTAPPDTEQKFTLLKLHREHFFFFFFQFPNSYSSQLCEWRAGIEGYALFNTCCREKIVRVKRMLKAEVLFCANVPVDFFAANVLFH